MTAKAKRTIETTTTYRDTRGPQTAAPDVEFKPEPTHSSMAELLGIEIPTGRRAIAGFVVTLLVSMVGGYYATMFSAYVAVAAILMTGSTFFAFIAMCIALVLGIYISAVAASRAGTYVASGHLERDAVRAKDWTLGLFAGCKAKFAHSRSAA